MPVVLGAAATRAARGTAQGLFGPRSESVVDAVCRVVGLQAQDVKANRLAVRVRTVAGVVQADVDAACNVDRTLIRTWAMRGTLHMLAAEDVGWVLGLLGPRFAAGYAGRRKQLGLDDRALEAAVDGLRKVLGDGEPLQRDELVSRLASCGVPLDPRSQAPAHLLMYAGMTGVVCRGPDVGADRATYTLLADWAGPTPAMSEDEAVVELARRYLIGHAPATPDDFASWAGLPIVPSRAAFEALSPELVEVEAAGRRCWVPAAVPIEENAGGVRLLGHFDTYLLGYESRTLVVDEKHDPLIQAGGGFIQPTILVDGRVVGLWRLVRKAKRFEVELEPFGDLAKRTMAGIRAEVRDLQRFLGLPVELR
ncbi:winged helix DNA-binding domain-containing protein [Kutzneria chonburiensis]|uniref:Winged helix DNA-binding domain-containing protein n=1 Tax=Kutzneria chonburiensis TaxID=1483604 RepID=A0ABV6MKH3_9PSEU|nr:winged helix DNA-binding domain-containing protein [Kutzneria chonburiensis]